MKKAPLFSALFAVVLILTACGGRSPSSNGSADSGNGTSSFRSGAGGTRALSADAKLALGTMKLEGTGQAVDPKTAATLIPLWQLLVQLHSSSSSAPQEVAAVVDQIKATMQPDQLNTINGMTLTQADIFTAFQAQGQASGSGGTSAPGGQGAQGFSRGNRGNGGVFVFGGGPGGGEPGGGFGGGFGAGGSRTTGAAGSQTSSALTAAQAAQARENAISALLENQLIRLLETKLTN